MSASSSWMLGARRASSMSTVRGRMTSDSTPRVRARCLRHVWRWCADGGQASALQTVEPVTYRCGTRRVCQARSSGSERDTRARPHAVAPMNCVPEDRRRRSTCTGRTHSPRARADGEPDAFFHRRRPSACTLLIVRSRAPDRAPRRGQRRGLGRRHHDPAPLAHRPHHSTRACRRPDPPSLW